MTPTRSFTMHPFASMMHLRMAILAGCANAFARLAILLIRSVCISVLVTPISFYYNIAILRLTDFLRKRFFISIKIKKPQMLCICGSILASLILLASQGGGVNRLFLFPAFGFPLFRLFLVSEIAAEEEIMLHRFKVFVEF